MDVKPVQVNRIVRFGVFELDLWTGELRKRGQKLRLQNQPLQILTALLESPGELVTREDLQKRLWSPGTFVDVDHSLSSAINKLRECLGDSAENPRFIETVGRRGYRFLAPAENQSATQRSDGKHSPDDLRKEQTEPYKLLVESVTDYAIFLMDADGYVKTWNPGAERIKGYHAEEIIGRHFSSFYTPEDIEKGRPELGLRTAREHGRFYAEGWRVRKDGARFWAGVLITAIRDPTGKVLGFSKVTREITDGVAGAEAASKRTSRLLHSRISIAVLSALAATLGTVGVFTLFTFWHAWQTRPGREPLMHFELMLQPPLDVRNWPLPNLALSHDGTHLIYRGVSKSGPQLYIRPLSRMQASPIPGTEGGYGPFFSPDGRWLGFFTERNIKKISLERGATPVSLCNIVMGSGASWGADDNIIFTAGIPGSLMQISATGGLPRTLLAADVTRGEQAFQVPELLPGDKSLVVTLVNRTQDPAQDAIVLYRLDTGEHRSLVQGNVARYAATGDLVYARGPNLYAAPFDLSHFQLKEPSVPIADNIATTSARASLLALSDEGSLAYAAGGPAQDRRELVWVDRQGKSEPVPAPMLPYERPRLSPKGDRVAVTIHDPKPEIRVYALHSGAQPRLISEGTDDESATWRPDGKQLTFVSSRSGRRIISSKPLIGNAIEQVLLTGTQCWEAISWSPDGKQLALADSDPTRNGDLWILPIDGQRTPKPVVRTPYHERGAVLSSDGLWLAYASDESGRDEIYVQSVPALSGKFQVSTEGGVEPVWGRNGRELFFRNGEKVMISSVTTGDTFTAGTPQLLFEAQFDRDPWGEANYDVAPDSNHLLMVRNAVQLQPTQVHVVKNWFEDMQSLMPHGSH